MIRVAFCVGQYPPDERKLRIDAALSYASAEVEVGILDVEKSPFPGLSSADIQGVADDFHRVFIRAEKEGYDAVVPLGMLDLGVDGGRCLVDIPVIGPAHATFHVAALIGERFGVIAYVPGYLPRLRAQVREYGMSHFVAGYRSVSMPIREMTANRDKMVETFLRVARSLIDEEGADVIVPHGISLCPTHIKPDWLARELGVPVVEGIGAPIRVAAMLAGLGYRQSRIRWPKAPQG